MFYLWMIPNTSQPSISISRQYIMRWHVRQYHSQGPFSHFGIMGLQGKNWDYGITPCLKLGLCKIGFTGLHLLRNWDYGITLVLTSGLQDLLWGPYLHILQKSALKSSEWIISAIPFLNCCRNLVTGSSIIWTL